MCIRDRKKDNIQKNALLIVVMDTMVALMAGLCVLPGRFVLHGDEQQGRATHCAGGIQSCLLYTSRCV